MTASALSPDCHPRIRELHDYWLGLWHDGDTMPGRQDFSPFAVKHLLPDLWLLDVQHDPLRFRYRLIGTRIVERHGRDHTGRWVDEVHPSFVSPAVQGQFKSAAECGTVGWRRGHPLFAYDNRPGITIERIILPLASDGAIVDMLLGLTIYRRGAEADD